MTKLHKDKHNGKKANNGTTFPCSKFKIDANNKTINLLHIYKFLCKYKVSISQMNKELVVCIFFPSCSKAYLVNRSAKDPKSTYKARYFPSRLIDILEAGFLSSLLCPILSHVLMSQTAVSALLPASYRQGYLKLKLCME